MYKQSLSILILFIGLQAFGQITITSTDLPNATTQLPLAKKDSAQVDLLSASVNAQVWDWTDALADLQLDGESTDFVDFGPVAGTIGEADFAGSEFSRTSNLRTILGFDLTSFLPQGNGGADLPANAYFSTDANGDVFLDGVTANVTIDNIELGIRVFNAEPTYRFYSTGTLGDNYSTSTSLSNTILVEELPFTVPIVSYFILNINVTTEIEIDAFGEMILPDTTLEVIRYKENSIITAQLTAWTNALGNPVQINPDIIPADVFAAVDLNPDEVFIDTTFNSNLYRFFAKGINYPLATANVIGEEDVIETLEYYVEPIDLNVVFDAYPVIECNTIFIEQLSDGLGVTYEWNMGDDSTFSEYGNKGNFFYTYDALQEYEVILTGTDALGNIAADTIVVDPHCWATGIETLLDETDYELFPNPMSNQFSLQLHQTFNDKTIVHIYDVTGKILLKKDIDPQQTNIRFSTESFPQGTYFVKLSSVNGEVLMREKVLKY